MEWYVILLLILGGVCLLYVVIDIIISIFVMKTMMEPNHAPFDVAYKKCTQEYNIFTDDEYNNSWNKQEFFLKSKYGYNLSCMYIPKNNDIKFADGKERVAIMCHGWTSCKLYMYSYARMYLNLGFHVFMYDHRNHGLSDTRLTTMGDKEADDLQTVVEYVKEKMGSNIILGMQGESMGSATVMLHASRYHSVDFVVEDCGYSSLKDLLYYLCKYDRHLPTFPTLFFGNIIFKLKTKTKFKDVEPASGLKGCNEIPMYFVHGDNDNFVPSYMVYKCYDAKLGPKMISVYKNSSHARCIRDYPSKYQENLKIFLTNFNIIDKEENYGN